MLRGTILNPTEAYSGRYRQGTVHVLLDASLEFERKSCFPIEFERGSSL